MCFECSDPWVTKAIRQVTGIHAVNGCGNCGLCNIFLYNNGHWNSYSELLSYVRTTINRLDVMGLTFKQVGGQFLLGWAGIPGHVFPQHEQTLVVPRLGSGLAPSTVNLATGATQKGVALGLLTNSGGAVAFHGGVAPIGKAGAGLISSDGVGLISSDGVGLISSDGVGIVPRRGGA